MFTRYFLEEGITETAAWQTVDAAALDAFDATVRACLTAMTPDARPNEAETRAVLIEPVLRALGWADLGHERSATPHAVPDLALFPSETAKTAAAADIRPYRHAVAVVECKRWQRPLDRGEQDSEGRRETPPSSQLNRYLTELQGPSEHRLHWGILTNGRAWRLYTVMARSRSEDFLELDLPALLGLDGFADDLFAPPASQRRHWLTVFFLLFGRAAFPTAAAARDCFLVRAIDEDRNWEARLAENLRSLVFDDLYPRLVAALADHDPLRPRETPGAAYCATVRDGALVLLYRLLFTLFAEDRGLLPVTDPKYDDYGLRRKVREEVERRVDLNDVFASRIDTLYCHLRGLFGGIADGEPSLGLPPYNGGLFDPMVSPILARAQIPDAAMAPVIDGLSRTLREGRRRRINYRDLSVRQLGSIYEGLLEFQVTVLDGSVRVDRQQAGRHASGSYYTPDAIVDLIVRRVAEPLVENALGRFRAELAQQGRSRRPVAERLEALRAQDAALAILSLKFVDPAMGSGHFLVALVDYLADRVLDAIAEAEQDTVLGRGDIPYLSPVTEAIERVRRQILDQAARYGWRVTAAQLDDRLLVRRMILKRCIYGVDKNPMAVELTKVTLWLHTFTIGAPLSFLDHHLRAGDSLLGDRVRTLMDWLERFGALHISRHVQKAKRSAEFMIDIERMVDADIGEAKRSAAQFRDLEKATAPLARFMDLCRALRCLDFAAEAKAAGLTDDNRKRHVALRRAALLSVLDGTYGDPIAIAAGQTTLAPPPDNGETGPAPTKRPSNGKNGALQFTRAAVYTAAQNLLADARSRLEDRRYLHWEVAFPGVWNDWESTDPRGGFDGLVGNPPYVRHELLADSKPELAVHYASYDGKADLYVYFFERGLGLLKPGARLGFVVTNKWLRAGYAKGLRAYFGTATWVEAVIDFGHAKQFFPEADVFPSIVITRRPSRPADPVPDTTRVVVIPRDQVRMDEVPDQVATAGHDLPRAGFGEAPWRLDPPEVQHLMDKIGQRGVPLVKYAGASPLYGIKTGYNEAFLIDTSTKEKLCAEDPSSAGIIKPYLRGQDVKRWSPDWANLWMITLKSSENWDWPWAGMEEADAEGAFSHTYPSVYRHVKAHERYLRLRQDKGRYWWELRSCSYYDVFEQEKLIYTEITWTPSVCRDGKNFLINNTAYILGVADPWLIAVLNSPAIWWYAWRQAVHGKDEALRLIFSFMSTLPIAPANHETIDNVSAIVDDIEKKMMELRNGEDDTHRWLAIEHGIGTPPRILQSVADLSEEQFLTAARKAIKRRLSPAVMRNLSEGWRDTIAPLRTLKAEMAAIERMLGRLVEEAYGLTDEDRALMWRTAPPRMPLPPPSEFVAETTDDDDP